MYNIVDYSKNIELLGNSVLYKLDSIAITNNAHIKKYYPSVNVTDDKHNWKYYVNLSGNYHEIDNLLYPDGLKVKLLETGVIVKLTSAILRNNRQTREDILLKGDTYKQLINDYPNCNLLLRGLLHPTNIERLISVKDGTILGFNTNLVEAHEVTLMFKLELSIKAIIERWHNSKISTYEELYTVNLMKSISSMVILKLHNLRLDAIHTREAHSFHMGQFFNSTMDIGKYLDTVPYKQKIWLYKHLKYITTNIGQNESYKSLLNNLLYPVGIDVVEYVLDVNAPLLKKDTSDITQPTYDINSDNVYSISNKGVKKINIDDLTFKCFETISDYKELFNITEITTFNKIKNDTENIEVKEQTKVISLVPSTTSFTGYLDNVELLLDNWIYMAFNIGVDIEAYYINKHNGKNYKLNSKSAIFVVLKMILTMNNKVNDTFTTIKTNRVFKTTEADILLNIDPKFMETSIVNNMPDITEVNNTIDSIRKFIFNLKDWIFRSNVVKFKDNNPIKTAMLDLVMERLSKPKNIVLGVSYRTVDEYLNDFNIDYPTTVGVDYTKDMTDIVRLFTGSSLNTNKDIVDKLLNYKGILDSLTSYTMLVTVDKNKDSISLPYNAIGFNAGLDAFNIDEGTSKCLEYPYGTTLTAICDNNNDRLLIADSYTTKIVRDGTGRLDINIGYDFNELYITNNCEIKK